MEQERREPDAVALGWELEAIVDTRTLEIIERRRRRPKAKRRGWLIRRALLAADVTSLCLTFSLAQFLFVRSGSAPDSVNVKGEFLVFFFSLPAWVVVAKVHGLYDRDEERTDHTTADDIVGVIHLVTFGTWIFFAGTWLSHLGRPQTLKVATFWLIAILLMPILRSCARAVCRRQMAYLQNTIIIGADDVGQKLAAKLLRHPEYGINLVGFVDDDSKRGNGSSGQVRLLGPLRRLPSLVRAFDIERVILAFPGASQAESLDVIRSMKGLDVQVDIVPRLFDVVSPGIGVHTIEGVPLIGLPPPRLSRSSKLLKRAFDVTLSSTALILLAPLFLLIALLIKLESPGPILFRQVRMGEQNRIFRIFKFRTMNADADERKHEFAHLNQHLRPGGDPRMFKIPNDPRTTRVGRFLRRTSLDELPQLLNVLTGKMSLVGPRPLILDEDRFVEEWGRERLNLKPGVTGPWQVMGRSDIPFDEMVNLDYLYVTTWSLYADLKLMLRTIPALIGVRRTT